MKEKVEESAKLFFSNSFLTINLLPYLAAAALLVLLAVFLLPLLSPAESSGYGAPDTGYGAPAASYGAPADSYGAPEAGYSAPAAGYDAQYRSVGGDTAGETEFSDGRPVQDSGYSGLSSLVSGLLGAEAGLPAAELRRRMHEIVQPVVAKINTAAANLVQ